MVRYKLGVKRQKKKLNIPLWKVLLGWDGHLAPSDRNLDHASKLASLSVHLDSLVQEALEACDVDETVLNNFAKVDCNPLHRSFLVGGSLSFLLFVQIPTITICNRRILHEQYITRARDQIPQKMGKFCDGYFDTCSHAESKRHNIWKEGIRRGGRR